MVRVAIFRLPHVVLVEIIDRRDVGAKEGGRDMVLAQVRFDLGEKLREILGIGTDG